MLVMIEPFPSYCTGSRFCAEFTLKSPCWGSENVRRSIHSRRIPCKPQMHRGGFPTIWSNGNGPCRVSSRPAFLWLYGKMPSHIESQKKYLLP